MKKRSIAKKCIFILMLILMASLLLPDVRISWLGGWTISITGNQPIAAAGNEKSDEKEKEEITSDQLAWQSLKPEIESFWSNMEIQPYATGQQVWGLIYLLKDFIKRYPDSGMVPEAYYIIGEAYAAAGFWPEALAHWKIILRYFPDSSRTSDALNSIVSYLTVQGDRKKVEEFYMEILSQFPDSIAALTAKCLLAEQALASGDTALARKTIEKIETRDPDALAKIPEILELKARFAKKDGDIRKAIDYWLHYLNLIRSRQLRARTLFTIAEAYREQGQVLMAKKYYALIRRDFSNAPEGLFARFRLLQIEEKAALKLKKVTGKEPKTTSPQNAAVLLEKIVKLYPRHPLTDEVMKELIETELKAGNFLKAMLDAERFLKRNPDSRLRQNVISLAEQAGKRLISTDYSVVFLTRAVETGKDFLRFDPSNPVQEMIREATQKLWLKLMDALISNKSPELAMSWYWDYRTTFQHDPTLKQQAIPIGKRAIAAFDQQLIEKKKGLHLCNYHYNHIEGILELKSARHHYYLAQALESLGLSKAAARGFYSSWRLGPSDDMRCPLLLDWARVCVTLKAVTEGSNVLALLDQQCPEGAMSPEAMLVKAEHSRLQHDWHATYNMASGSLDLEENAKAAELATEALIMLGSWKKANTMLRRYRELIPVAKQMELLRLMGDQALQLQEGGVALDSYVKLMTMQQDSRPVTENAEIPPADLFRKAMATRLLKGAKAAQGEFAAISKRGESPWKEAAKEELKLEQFLDSVAGIL